ncbi:MAG TPA: hypothetical protein VGB37_13015 [Candidatus Lokiarchaeia archaeon]
MSNRIVIVDGGFVLHRSVLAFKNTEESSPFLRPTFYFLRMIIGYLKRLKIDLDDQIIIALDGRNSWRKDYDPNYKANRKINREKQADAEWWNERFAEFDIAFEEWNKLLNWNFLKLERIESDDFASVACRLFKDKEIILVTQDGDWKMLSTFPNVKIMNPTIKSYKSKAKNATLFQSIENGYAILEEKINKGDVSDNIKGKPQNEIEYENRKKIVDLIHELPSHIETKIRQKLIELLPKNLYINKIKSPAIRKELEKLYNVED